MSGEAVKKDRLFLSGNEAIALGAFEAGVKVASAYPGTPSTEIIEALTRYEDVYTEWAPNEKVALEVALGASFGGARALVSMKHVGLNVAADPLFTSAYTGVRGGLVIITCDDPEMHSSQNEQDNRNYAFAAKMPMLEPSDPEEARRFTKIAFELSERFDTPVLVRSTTRISHVKGIVDPGERSASTVSPGIVKDPEKFVMLPINARKRRRVIEDRMKSLKVFADGFLENRIEKGTGPRGFISSGVSYGYVKEAFPDAPILKLGMVFPFPENMVREFASYVDELFIIEELDPFIELHVKAMGVRCEGKEHIPSMGELDSTLVKSTLEPSGEVKGFEALPLPGRPPNLCPGCPHRGLFYALSRLNVFVAGDIGCYTLAFFKPLSAMDSCVCMGASIGNAFGIEKAVGRDSLGKVVAVIGDSTFLHSGIAPLMDIVYNGGFSTVIILDNRTTGMTGQQPTPASGERITGDPADRIDIEALCRAIGVRHVYPLDPNEIDKTYEILKREVNRPEPSVVITQYPCVLLPEERKKEKPLYRVALDKCTGCRVCLNLGCPAIEWVPVKEEEGSALGFRESQRGYARINPTLCDGCGQCPPLCKFQAILPTGGNREKG